MADSIYLEKGAELPRVIKGLKRDGIVVIPGFLSPTENGILKSDVEKLLDLDLSNSLKGEESKLSRFKMSELAREDYPGLHTVSDEDLLQDLACDFFRPYSPNFNRLYVHHDKTKMEFNNAWHFDRGLTLKYFFYLNDVKVDNGAFWYDVGSHRENAVKQHLWWEAGLPSLNYVGESAISSAQPIEGPAGTLIIFDVSGYHKAGEISDGTERWVARIHVTSGRPSEGGRRHANPFMRRNLEYRLNCFSAREEDQESPWGDDARLFGSDSGMGRAGNGVSAKEKNEESKPLRRQVPSKLSKTKALVRGLLKGG